jgi:transposase
MIARRGVADGSGLGKVRWVVERAFAWLHQFKRLRTRYERRADLHQGLLELACSLIASAACEPHPEAISWLR